MSRKSGEILCDTKWARYFLRLTISAFIMSAMGSEIDFAAKEVKYHEWCVQSTEQKLNLFSKVKTAKRISFKVKTQPFFSVLCKILFLIKKCWSEIFNYVRNNGPKKCKYVSFALWRFAVVHTDLINSRALN